MAQQAPYPVQLSVDFPDRPLNRLTTLLRIFTVIPIAIVLGTVSAPWSYAGDSENATSVLFIAGAGGGFLFLGPLLMILFRQKYPRWWFNWNLELMRFSYRVTAYAALLRDEYPSTDEEQAVHLDIAYPDAARDLNRWLPLVKWLLAIPHYIVLYFLFIIAFIVVIIAWFAILFTSRYPRGMFDFVVGVMRWGARVTSYSLILVTDRYPPFRFNP